MKRSGLFRNNKTQAMRIPKSIEYSDTVQQVDIIAQGRTLIVTPAGESWESWFDGEGVSEDFARDQFVSPEREVL